jgi:hypothetical protein
VEIERIVNDSKLEFSHNFVVSHNLICPKMLRASTTYQDSKCLKLKYYTTGIIIAYVNVKP